MAEKFSYDKALKQVEDIIAKLQSEEESNIDAEMSNVEKALELLNKCKEQLTATSEKLDKLFEEKE